MKLPTYITNLLPVRWSTSAMVFDTLLKFLIVVLPFHVLLSVFLEHKVGVPNVTLYKEGVLAIMAGILIFNIGKKHISVKLDTLDWLIFAYIGWLTIVTFFYPQPLSHLFYGGRYDFEFLGAFLIIKHGIPLLSERPMYYVKLFIQSASAALVLGILVRWIFGETILLHFGFTANLSNWMFGGSIPIYHGIDQANVRRFQGIFDGPNPAGFFILFYLGMLVTYFVSAKKYYYLLSLWAIVLLGVLFYTYSRSALIGMVLAIACVIILHAKVIFQKHTNIVLWIIPILIVMSGLFFLKFENTIDRIILREGSTKGHFDRSLTGIKRAIVKPFGSGLASAGPAYRYVQQPEISESLFEGENKTKEDYYIPESWYIQQLVEGGFIGFLLFIAILITIMMRLVQRHKFILGAFIGMCAMNLFLHSFESIYISLLLFMFLAIFIYHDSPRLRSR